MKETHGRGHGVMSLELFKKIVDDICEFEKPIKVLRLYKDGEPWLNPKLAEMISYAKSRKCAERIDTTTNASLLTPEKNLAVIDAGLDRINISIEGVNAKQYQEFSNYKIDFEKLVANIRHFYEHKKQCEVIVKINGDILTEDDKKKFYEIFGDIADGVYRDTCCWPEFELKDVNVNQGSAFGQKSSAGVPLYLLLFFHQLERSGEHLLPDWSRKLIIGDAKTGVKISGRQTAAGIRNVP
jgi:hypothetical protein